MQRIDGSDPSLSFYDFAKKEKPAGRGGVGTVVIHRYSDKVGYYMSDKGGLIVSLSFDKPSRK